MPTLCDSTQAVSADQLPLSEPQVYSDNMEQGTTLLYHTERFPIAINTFDSAVTK